MFSRVLSKETSSEASSNVSVSIWSTIDVSLGLLLLDEGVLEEAVDASALGFDPPVAGGGAAAFEFGEMEADG